MFAARRHHRARPASRRPDDGGVVELTTARTASAASSRCCRSCSQRYVVRAAQLMAGDAAEHAGLYADRCAACIDGR